MFPQGIGMVHFHEKSDDVNEKTGKLIQPFHTHTHLSNTKGYFKKFKQTSKDNEYSFNKLKE